VCLGTLKRLSLTNPSIETLQRLTSLHMQSLLKLDIALDSSAPSSECLAAYQLMSSLLPHASQLQSIKLICSYDETSIGLCDQIKWQLPSTVTSVNITHPLHLSSSHVIDSVKMGVSSLSSLSRLFLGDGFARMHHLSIHNVINDRKSSKGTTGSSTSWLLELQPIDLISFHCDYSMYDAPFVEAPPVVPLIAQYSSLTSLNIRTGFPSWYVHLIFVSHLHHCICYMS
jgi:hypothetical protein